MPTAHTNLGTCRHGTKVNDPDFPVADNMASPRLDHTQTVIMGTISEQIMQH